MDWVGYTTGLPAQAIGMIGALDFVGYSVGNNTTAPTPDVFIGTGHRPKPKKRKEPRVEDDEIILLL